MFGYLKKQRAIQEIDRRRSDPLTYTSPVEASDPNEWKDFLSEFYRSIIFGRREELKQELIRYPIVNQHYQALVVTSKQLAYEDFWQRYLFRCGDIDRVIRQLDERDAQFRKDSIQKLKGSIVGSVEQYYQQVATIASAASSSPSRPSTAKAEVTTSTNSLTTTSKSPRRAAFQATTSTEPIKKEATGSHADDHEKKIPGKIENEQTKDENQDDSKQKSTSLYGEASTPPVKTESRDNKQQRSIVDNTISSSLAQNERTNAGEDTADASAPTPTSVTEEHKTESGNEVSLSNTPQVPTAETSTKLGVSNFLSSYGFSKDMTETSLATAVSSPGPMATDDQQESNPQEDDQQKQLLEKETAKEKIGNSALIGLQTQINEEKELCQDASQTLNCSLKYNKQEEATEAMPSQVTRSAWKPVKEITSFFRRKGNSTKLELSLDPPQSSMSSSPPVTNEVTDSKSSYVGVHRFPDEIKSSSEPLMTHYNESMKGSFSSRMAITTTALMVVLVAALLGLRQSTIVDGLCGPIIPFRRFHQPVSGKAPWWSPEEPKTMYFGKLCGNRLHTTLILDQKGKFEMWTTKSQKLVKRRVHSFYATTNTIVLEYQNDNKVQSRNTKDNSHLKTELLKAPWSSNI